MILMHIPLSRSLEVSNLLVRLSQITEARKVAMSVPHALAALECLEIQQRHITYQIADLLEPFTDLQDPEDE